VANRDLPRNIREARGYEGYVAYLRNAGKQKEQSFSIAEYGSGAKALEAAQNGSVMKRRKGAPGEDRR
jgi:hypothetical protein